MKKCRTKRFLIVPITVGIIEFVWLYFASKTFFNNNILISINNVNWDNICIKFLSDFLTMLLLPLIIIIINGKYLNDFRLCIKNQYEILILLGVMIILFFLHNDYNIRGFYKFFFYLFVVAFGEEFIYRGYLYNKIKVKSKVLAIILSGILWGIPHALLPSIVSEVNISLFLLSLCSEIGMGIVMGWYFIYLQEKSKTLWIPILVHAILDYTVGIIGIIVAIVIFIYFLMKSQRNHSVLCRS